MAASHSRGRGALLVAGLYSESMHEQLYVARPGGYPQCTVLDPQRNAPRQFATHMLPPAGSQPKLRLSTHGAKLACLTSSQWRRVACAGAAALLAAGIPGGADAQASQNVFGGLRQACGRRDRGLCWRGTGAAWHAGQVARAELSAGCRGMHKVCWRGEVARRRALAEKEGGDVRARGLGGGRRGGRGGERPGGRGVLVACGVGAGRADFSTIDGPSGDASLG